MALVEEGQKPGQAIPSKGEQRTDTGRSTVRERGAPAAGEQRSTSRLAALRRHPWITAAVAILILAVLGAGVIWWLNARQYESTDDAFIDTRIVSVSADVTGKIVAVPVTDNQFVKVGASLVQIDPRDYKAAVAQARAQLAEAKASVANIDAQIDAQLSKIAQAKTQVTQTHAALTYAEQQNARAQNLWKTGAGTEQNAQQAASQLIQSRAAYAAAQASETVAEKQLPVLHTQRDSAAASINAAQAALEKAEVDLDRTNIRASVVGHIANLTAAVGAYAQPGQALMAIVPRKVWVTANFKETELADMHAGDPVDIKIDAYPGKTFRGHVQSIQAGSGVAFSLLPPENATGNFVKVVQRVPVKIVFNKPPDVLLGPGMSVVPSVKVR